jgi:hypothetical protein
MRRRACEADGVDVGGVGSGAWWPSGRAGGMRLAILLGLVCTCVMGRATSTRASSERCPNEEFRTGPSASLPDCRAYELVTPEELGRTQAITFTVADHAVPSADGEHLALRTYAPLEPGPSYAGTRAVISRTAQGWTAKSLVVPGAAARQLEMGEVIGSGVLSPNLSQVAFVTYAGLNTQELSESPEAFEVGPVGGPYALMAKTPAGDETHITGANAGTASVSAFNDVLFESQDHQLLPVGPERTIAEEAVPGAYDLYDWTGGTLRLVNVQGEGANAKALNPCGGGQLGGGTETVGAAAVGAVSADGSKIFFTSCGRLYMRVDGRETIEVSAPQGVGLNPDERVGVNYNAASTDGSEVVFNTGTPLLPGETSSENKLFMYDTVTHHLSLIVSGGGIPPTVGTGGDKVLLSEDGLAVYYEVSGSIYRYETGSGKTSFIAAIQTTSYADEASYTTPNGQFLVFVSGSGGVEVAGPHGGLELEPRGAAHNELYRYDAADGRVMCVSCGEGIAPEGNMIEPGTLAAFHTDDETPPFVQMSENGQKVFFQTTARLVPQDTNSTEITSPFSGMDVYEWEANGAEEAPGVVCRVVNGCTHLISTGEDVGKATFLGASENGSDVFFATASRLVPQATPEFPNIYDARVGGGFPSTKNETECLSCQGAGSAAPLFGPGASGTFAGAGNAALFSSTTVATRTTTTKKAGARCRGKNRERDVAKCSMAHTKGKGRKRAERAKSRRGAKRP